MISRFGANTGQQVATALLVASVLFPWCGSHAQDATSDWQMTQLVANTLQATVRIETARDRSSGVIVSDAGHILTVAHGLNSEQKKILIVHAGKQYSAVLLKRDIVRDLAIIRLIKPEFNMPKLELPARTDKTLKVGKLLVSTGCPARETNTAGPVARLGVVKALTGKYVRSNCALTAGDSGGPVVNSHGHLVGINTRIGLGRESNLHIPIGTVHAFLAGVTDLKTKTAARKNTELQIPWRKEVGQQLSRLQVKVVSPVGDTICLGTRLNETHIATKLSLVKSREFRVRINGIERDVHLTNESRVHDIAILKIALRTKTNDQQFSKPKHGGLQVGEFVYADAGLSGVVGRIGHTEPKSRPALGCTLLVDNQRGLLVEEVGEHTAAADAKLKPGDRLISFCGKPCLMLDDIGDAIAGFQPGDIVAFEVIRKQTPLEGFGRLRHRPETLLNRTEFLDGRSGELNDRRTGFSNVIQHDVAIDASDVGGPLLDSNGRLVAVNIARRSREAVLAIPIATVLQLVAETEN